MRTHIIGATVASLLVAAIMRALVDFLAPTLHSSVTWFGRVLQAPVCLPTGLVAVGVGCVTAILVLRRWQGGAADN